ncbi:hypothetical protein [Caballeronia calidae]|uniref:hypothetical protein n=1 Tax=Caballeronia calidae TaxID=1777139 RepID=UPI00094196EA|nr:hypothetical protein [Caballeronia calidae]
MTDGTMPETSQLLPSTNGYYDIPKQADGSIEILFGPQKPLDVDIRRLRKPHQQHQIVAEIAKAFRNG